MSAEERAGALLSLIEAGRREERSRVLSEASAAASSRVAKEHALARQRVRAALEDERSRAKLAVAAAEARAASRLRAALQRQSAGLLALARARLEEALLDCWSVPATRRQWMDHHLALAVRYLPSGAWLIQHPKTWDDVDGEHLEARIAAERMPEPVFSADEAIRAGVRFCSGDTVFDATIDGLLADEYEINGRLLNYLAEAAS